MSKLVSIRLDDATIQSVEKVRDAHVYPTQSDFVREAIRRMIRDERRRLVALEIDQYMRDPAAVRLAEEFAEANFADLADRLAQIETDEARDE